MTDSPTMDFVEGQGSTTLDFGDLDMRYYLKLRSHIDLCMPAVFRDLEQQFNMFALREEGVAPIMFYVKLEAEPVPLAFGRELTSEHTVGIFRHPPAGGEEAPTRLLLDSRSVFKAHRGSGDPGSLGWEKQKGALEEVGRAEVLQVFTQPLAPAGERGVTRVPAAMDALRVHPWEEPYPSVEGFQAVPEGYTQGVDTSSQEFISVWGMPNTDVNQHVNVVEYIGGMENQFSRLLHAEGLSLARHFIRRAELIFRKPFFPGQPYGVRGRLWRNGGHTLMVGAFHGLDPEGRMNERPHIAARYEGEIIKG